MEQTFENMQLNASLIDALKTADITVPTEIQQKVIPVAKQNNDLIFQSETGTGKTLAYLLPLFEKIDTEKKEMQALILVPTHELAIQVIRQIEMLSLNSELKVTSTPVIGDVNITRQIDKLRTKPHIIVGTAGRILELIQKKKISAHTVRTIIIDEADRLLDDSNIEGTKAVIKTTLKERQIMMCSASMSARTIERAKLFMKEPQLVKSSTAIEVPDTIDHLYFVAEQRDKIDVLRKLVRIINPVKAIAFFANAEDIAEATEKLKFHKLRADGLHGSNIKSDRKKTMDDFKSGRLQLLIASDIAARGLDIEGVTHIFNVSIPERSMEYLHRAGRTGRNGNEGVAISIATENEIPLIKQFEKELKISIIPKSMYNGVIVEYKKQNKRLDSTSEFEQRTIGRGKDKKNSADSEGNDKPESTIKRDGDKPAPKYKKDDRPGKSFSKDGGSPESRYKRDGDRPAYKKDGDRPAPKYRKDDRPGKSFSKDGGSPESRYKRDGDRPAPKYKKDDRSGKPFSKEGGRPESRYKKDGDKPSYKYKNDGDKPAPKYRKDDRPGKPFSKEGGRPESRYKNDGDKPSYKYKKDGDRPAASYKKDGNEQSPGYRKDSGTGQRSGKSGAKPAWKSNKDTKPDAKYKKSGNKPSTKYGREDKPAAGYKKASGKSDNIPFAKFRTGGKPGTNHRAGKKGK